MEIILYPGKPKKYLEYFTGLFDSADQPYKIEHCYFGYKLILYAGDTSVAELADSICRFIFDNYLKEAVVSKIYDEYPCFNTAEAGAILTKISENLLITPVKDSIVLFLTNNKTFNVESYCIFNLKKIMLCIYAVTDKICRDMMFEKEKEKFTAMAKIFSDISFEKCGRIDVEFSCDNKCSVSLDKSQPFYLSNDELLAFLVQKSPGCVNLKNSYFSPELSDIITDIFNSDKNK